MDKYITNDEIEVLIRNNYREIKSLAGQIAGLSDFEYGGTAMRVEKINSSLKRISELKAMKKTSGSEEE